jgi:hypothetical protein
VFYDFRDGKIASVSSLIDRHAIQEQLSRHAEVHGLDDGHPNGTTVAAGEAGGYRRKGHGFAVDGLSGLDS